MVDPILSRSDPFDKRSPFRSVERARRRRLLIGLSTGAIPAMVPFLIILGIMLVNTPSWQIATTFTITLLSIPLFVFVRYQGLHDRLTPAGYLALGYMLVIIGANGILIQGFSPGVAPSYIVIVTMAGMMLGVSGGFMIALLASAMWLLAQLPVVAVIVPAGVGGAPASGPLLGTTVIVILSYLFAAYMGYLATDDLHQALNDTTYQLVRANRQLENASADAQRAKERVEAILDNTPDVVLMLRNAEGGISEGNPSFTALFGYDLPMTYGRSLLSLIDPADVKPLKDAMQDVIALQKTVSLEVVAVRKDGTRFDAGLALGPVKGEGEVITGIVCAIRDITERVRVEEQIRAALSQKEAALAEREVLLKEIHHRVKNNLQVISSLLNLQSLAVEDDEARDLFLESQNRVQSMALIHEQLYGAADLAQIDFGTYIRNLADRLAVSYEHSLGLVGLSIDAEEINLPIDTAIPCGLIINEMVSNAYKHAFPDNANGTIRVGFHAYEAGMVTLTVSDDGVGFPSSLDFRRTQSLGMQLINTLSKQLRGRVDMESASGTGTTFRVVFPLASGS